MFGACYFFLMSKVTFEVEIDRRKVTPGGPHLIPEQGCGLLTVVAASPSNGTAAFFIGSEADGLAVIHSQGGGSTPALIWKIEGFAA